MLNVVQRDGFMVSVEGLMNPVMNKVMNSELMNASSDCLMSWGKKVIVNIEIKFFHLLKSMM